MGEDFEVFSEYEGEKVMLVYSQAFSMLSKNDSIEIQLPKRLVSWKIRLNFVETDAEKDGGVSSDFNESTVTFTLNKWFNDTWLENTKPWPLFSLDKTIYFLLKLRTTANKNHDLRYLQISIWQKIKN